MIAILTRHLYLHIITNHIMIAWLQMMSFKCGYCYLLAAFVGAKHFRFCFSTVLITSQLIPG